MLVKRIAVSIGKGETKKVIPAETKSWVVADFPEWTESPYAGEVSVDELVLLLNYAADLKARARARSQDESGVSDQQRTEALTWSLANDQEGLKATGGNPKVMKIYLNRVYEEHVATQA